MKSLQVAVACLVGTALAASLPQVDLGYEIHEAISYNIFYQLYNFTNIRYAQAPVGDLRFAQPVAPTGRNETIQKGTEGKICPQGSPSWTAPTGIPPRKPRETEDCLFLDVVVPKAVFEKRGQVCNQTSTGAPVVIWIHGGGYTLGSKDDFDAIPNGLIRASQADGSNGIIYVAVNYRLGALGWLAGPSVLNAGAVTNAGLLDQKLAIEWVSQNIRLFGGDPASITLMGESAGGGSIMHHITSYGGEQEIKFQRAIPQSPAFFPIVLQSVQEANTQTFFKLLNVGSIAEARKQSSQAVMSASAKQIYDSPYGQFTYGPAVDGLIVPDLPGVLLQDGRFHKNVGLLIGHNSNEGAVFTPPYIDSVEDFVPWLKSSLPFASPDTFNYITRTLYPPIYSQSPTGNSYRDIFGRASFIISEWIFTCNTNYLARAYGNATWNYEFQVPPAIHGADVKYTFSNGRPTNLFALYFSSVADAMQGYITTFVKTGAPNADRGASGKKLPWFPQQGLNASMNGLAPWAIRPQIDPTVNARCAWWQQALYARP